MFPGCARKRGCSPGYFPTRHTVRNVMLGLESEDRSLVNGMLHMRHPIDQGGQGWAEDPAQAPTRFSVSGIITPRRKSVTCPLFDETTSPMQSAATEMAAAAACREPRPLGSE